MTQGCRSLLHEGALSRSEFATAHSGHSDDFEWAPQGGQNFTPHQSAEVAMREGGIGQWAVELFWFALLTKIIHTHTHTQYQQATETDVCTYQNLKVHNDGCLFWVGSILLGVRTIND